jgi:predicted membrane channel-forming protein YqfA (hemolysin III family)
VFKDTPDPGLVIVAIVLVPIFALGMMTLWLAAVLYVFHDARRRGMPAGLWALVAAFVPYLIGFVIYFVTRKPLLQSCRGCGKDAPREAVHCPFCGAPLKKTCPACKATAEPEFEFCSSCGGRLNA